MRQRGIAKVAFLALMLAAPFLFGGCEYLGGPQNVFAPEGEVADRQRDLLWLVMIPAAFFFVLVEGLILWIVFKYRRKSDNDPMPAQVHGNQALEIGWTVAPTLLLIVLAVPMLAAIVDFSEKPEGSYNVTVTGRQWLWDFEYPDDADADGVAPLSDGVMHIPEDTPIYLKLVSTDVIHSFWVPKLAGKTDVVPGRNNHMWLKADKPGTYQGQCAEFCGFDHGVMRLTVVVHTEEDFRNWIEEQQAASAVAAPTDN